MRIRKLIKEELSDLSWIKNYKATLKDKVIEFEPMLNFEEWNQVLDLLMSHVVTFDEDIIWWSDRLLDDFKPLEEGQYLHHLIISKDGRMAYGAMDLDMVDTLRDDGFSEDEIANAYEDFYESIDLFLDDHSGKFGSPETIDGRKYFNIPYKKPIKESEEWGWVKEIEPKWDSLNIHLVAGKKFYVSGFSTPQYKAYWFEDNIRPKPKKKTMIPMPPIKVCWEEGYPKRIKCAGQSRSRIIEKLNKGTWVLINEETIKESEEFDFINDSPELHGVTFKVAGFDQTYQINDVGFRSYVDITWIKPNGEKDESAYKRDTVNKYFRDGTWVVYDGPYSESINESEELEWITNTELPILPYIGKRFKLILDGGKDSGRRYKIIDYYYEGKYNKNYYVNCVLLDPETLKETQKIFNSPMDRSMELIKDGNWVFIDKI